MLYVFVDKSFKYSQRLVFVHRTHAGAIAPIGGIPPMGAIARMITVTWPYGTLRGGGLRRVEQPAENGKVPALFHRL